ncbi:MAG TPA: VWA domain-containing protein, partial [Gaiellales bacterium]
MSLARPWWLAALALLLPLLVLHLRRPALTIREVPSLFLWERLAGTAAADTRRLRRPRHPLLLAVQACALSGLVLALAGPTWDRGSHAAADVYVVDGSFWMQPSGRLAAARDELVALADARRANRVAVVSATATPEVVYRGSREGLRRGLAHLQAGAGSGDLVAGMTLGAGLLGDAAGRMIVLRAPESPLPATSAARGQLVSRVIGRATDDQGIFGPTARCGIGPNEDCEVLATVRNDSATARSDRYTASAAGQRTVAFHVTVPARSSTAIALTARPGSILRLRLTASDSLALDDSASVAVPGTDNAPAAATVTLVGDP